MSTCPHVLTDSKGVIHTFIKLSLLSFQLYLNLYLQPPQLSSDYDSIYIQQPHFIPNFDFIQQHYSALSLDGPPSLATIPV